MIYLLVRKETHFVDGYGTPELGEIEYSVVEHDPDDKSSYYHGIKPGILYDLDIVELGYGIEESELEQFDLENPDQHYWKLAEEGEYEHRNEGGYNCKVRYLEVKQITKIEADTFQAILNSYQWLQKQF